MSGFGKSKVQLWETTLEKLGRILSEEYGIKVIFKYDVCMTTGKEIYLPVIPEGARQEFLDAIQGYLDHEVSHILHTDFDVVERSIRIGKKLQMILNALEDGRAETAMIKLWRGSKINLANCREWSLPQLKERWDELSDFGKVVQGVCAIAIAGEDHWFIQDVVAQDPEAWARVEQVKEFALAAPEMESTEEAFEAAQKIMEILDEEDEPGEMGEGEGSEGECECDCDENGTPIPGAAPCGNKNCKCKPQPFGPISDEQLANDEQIMSPQEQIRQQCQKDNFKYSRQPDRYLVYTTEGDVLQRIEDGDRQQCHQFLTDSRALTNPIRQRFRRNLLSEAKCRWDPGRRRGSVNPASLHRGALGTSKAVFRKLIEAASFDTVVSMFVDHSGSMFPTKMDMAAETTIIFGECLYDIKVPFEICGFSTMQYHVGNSRWHQASQEERDLFTRWGDLWIGEYKRFEDHWPTTRHRCVQMSRNDRDNTFDGEALRVAAQRLLRRPEKRKILFWLNDGYPCPNVHQYRQQHCAYLSSIAKEVEKLIEVFAIGIQSDEVQEYFTNWVVVNDLSDLPKVAVGELDRLLRRKQNAYGKARVA
jgi:cobalamin biosynthesis protein CobT